MVANEAPIQLSKTVCEQIDHWVAKYPPEQKQSAILPALTIIQEAHEGWLSPAHLNAAADYLQMSRIAVYEVATFYTMYDLQPVGRHKIAVCTNVSCMLADSDRIMTHLCERLKIKPGETTADGEFTLKEVECLGACVNAPMMQIDKDFHEHLTEEKVDDILARYRQAKESV
jgi:NADH-quinone oxidoreductase subunit E